MIVKGFLNGTGLLTGTLTLSSVLAADLFVFPTKGQSEEQTEKDKYSCYQWASKASGYDPMSQSQPASSLAPACPNSVFDASSHVSTRAHPVG